MTITPAEARALSLLSRVAAHRGAARRARAALAAAPAPAAREWVGPVVLTVPLLLVNGVAVFGQQQWASLHATHGNPWAAWALAATLESVGVLLAYYAHRALLAGDSALGKRLGSYGVALLVGYLNYSVHLRDGLPAAYAFGGLSVISPWLWAIHSRARYRDQLRARGEIDPRSVRFAAVRWFLFPLRTAHVWRQATWAGITSPDEAIRSFGDWRPRWPWTEERPAAPEPAPEPLKRPAPVAAPDPQPAPARRPPRKRPAKPPARRGPEEPLLSIVRPLVAAGQGAGLVGKALREGGYPVADRRVRELVKAARAEGGDGG